MAVGAVLTMLLPPVVYGAGAVGLALPAVAVAIGTLVAAVVLCFAHAARPWAYDVVARPTRRRAVADPPTAVGRWRTHPRPTSARRRSRAAPRWEGRPRVLQALGSGGDHVEGDRSRHLVVELDRDLVGAERLDRVADDDRALVEASPDASVSAAAMSAEVTAPKSRPPSPALTLTWTASASSLALISTAWSASRTARAVRAALIDSACFSAPRVQTMAAPRGRR